MMYGKNGFVGTMEIIENVFFEWESSYVAASLQENEEYMRFYQDADDLVSNNKALFELFENNHPVSLSREDSAKFLEYLELERKQNDIWRMELFKTAQRLVIDQLVRDKCS